MEQPPDQLLSDVAMPGMDGITLAMTVADTLPHCRVILFSGHASTRDLTAARAAGYDFPLLAKPIHPKEMLQRIFAALDGPAKHPHTRRNAGQHAVPVGLQTLQVTI